MKKKAVVLFGEGASVDRLLNGVNNAIDGHLSV